MWESAAKPEDALGKERGSLGDREVLVPQCLPCLERPRGRVVPKSCVVPGSLGWVGDRLLTRAVEAEAPPTASLP
ncbi:unnamed protein product [Rangifer tarandus platyrhynchus]|uniref:Uncharacterized protein n=1 Tax=Rangifer tarandus platyrhynchus TaxID=3082113 RepID=A0AC59YW31_RANTA